MLNVINQLAPRKYFDEPLMFQCNISGSLGIQTDVHQLMLIQNHQGGTRMSGCSFLNSTHTATFKDELIQIGFESVGIATCNRALSLPQRAISLRVTAGRELQQSSFMCLASVFGGSSHFTSRSENITTLEGKLSALLYCRNTCNSYCTC